MSEDLPQSAEALVEALLLASSRPVEISALASAAQLSTQEAEAAAESLRERYSPGRSGIVVRRVGGGYQLATNPACAEAVDRLRGEARPAPLSGAATEVLAAVLYFGPLTRAAISSARGVNSDAVVRSLMDRGLLYEAGSDSDAPGSPATLDVTEQLLVAAGADSRQDFPPLESLVEEEELARVRQRVTGSSDSSSEGASGEDS